MSAGGGTSGTAPAETPTANMPALRPTRIDTLRDAQGEFFSPQFTSLALTVAGNTIAIDSDDKQLVLFDTTGRELYRVGRNGGGPGEFRFPRGIFVLPGDSIAVWDMGLRRMSVFDAKLKFQRTEQFAKWNFTGDESALVGRLADGRWVARIVAGSFNPDATPGARLVVDTARLMAGRSDEEPVEFHRLPLRSSVEVVLKTGPMAISVHKLRPSELNVSEGAVCERGIVLVDSGGVRRLDASGRVVHAWPVPRTGEKIQTAAERSEIVRSEMPSPVASSSMAKQTRTELERLVGASSVRMRRPMIDAHGRLWYHRRGATEEPSIIADRVDSIGHGDAALALKRFGGGVRISSNSAAMVQYGSDTTGLTVALAHYPPSFTRNVENNLGRCAASFDY